MKSKCIAIEYLIITYRVAFIEPFLIQIIAHIRPGIANSVIFLILQSHHFDMMSQSTSSDQFRPHSLIEFPYYAAIQIAFKRTKGNKLRTVYNVGVVLCPFLYFTYYFIKCVKKLCMCTKQKW